VERDECRQQEPPDLKNKKKAQTILNRGQEPLRQALYRASGADLTAIDGLGVETVQAVSSEYGTDLSAFPKEKQFVKHVRLAPNRPTSGGKPVKKKNKHGTASSRVAAALRMAALSLRHSQTALGAYYRQIARHKGDDVAIFATARKLATLIYRMLRMGQELRGRGSRSLREALPGRPSPTPHQSRQGARLPTRAATRKPVTTPGPKTKSQARGLRSGFFMLRSERNPLPTVRKACGPARRDG